MPPKLKLTYVDAAARAEPIRLAFAIGDIEFEDVRLGKEQIAEEKAAGKYPMDAVPVLEVDGKVVCQSDAILTWASKVSGLYPADAFVAMKADEVRGCCDDIFFQHIPPTFAIKDLDERIAKRKELVAGPLGTKIAALNKLLERNGNKLAVSDQITVADVKIYSFSLYFTSGFIDGIPTDIFDKYDKIQASIKAVKDHPKVEAFYEKRKKASAGI